MPTSWPSPIKNIQNNHPYYLVINNHVECLVWCINLNLYDVCVVCFVRQQRRATQPISKHQNSAAYSRAEKQLYIKY